MNLSTRSILVFVLLSMAIAATWMMERHVAAKGVLKASGLARPLEALPLELDGWVGKDRPIEEKLLYGDSHLQRAYTHKSRNQAVLLWIAFSTEGKDRGHHPEVCMAVAGQPEDTKGRQTCEAPGHEAPVQQYRFGRPGRYQLVYYWHYTLVNPKVNELTTLQKLYTSCRKRPASMTIEVFAPETAKDDMQYAQQFVRAVDKYLQHHLGPNAVRGSRRVPVTVVAQE